MSWPVTLVMFRARQGCRWQGRANKTSPDGATRLFGGVRRRADAEHRISESKAHLTWVEDEDVASGITVRPERGKCCRSGH